MASTPDVTDPRAEGASARVVDFAEAARQPNRDDRDEDVNGHVLTPKQVRARARRKMKVGEKILESVRDSVWKPLEEWDAEELARGRPRAADGTFKGRTPAYISRELHEKAMEKFKQIVKFEMNAQTVEALAMINKVLTNDEVDDKGKPIVAASTKLDAAKFLIEHVIGKPTQPTQTDISVKLQGILGAVMVNPADLAPGPSGRPALPAGYELAHTGSRGEVVDLDEEDYWEEDDG